MINNIIAWCVSLYDTWVWLLAGTANPFKEDDNDNILY